MKSIWTAMGLLAAVAATGATGRCRLAVSDVSGVGEWPLVGGLPLPTGLIADPTCIRVLDATGNEVPCQVDVGATYRDGSIRWALLSMVGSPAGEYTAEFGPEVKRAPVAGIRMTEEGNGFRIDTGAAEFLLTRDNLLIQSARLADGVPLWSPGECVAYTVDNEGGRYATCAGPAAEISLAVLKSGPIRAVVRSEGWYVSPESAQVARGVARMTFFAGSAAVQISHSLVFTENTNEVWFRDYGLVIPLAGRGEATATFDVDRAFDATARAVPLAAGGVAELLQSEFPHFAETASRFTLTRDLNELLAGEACGEWVDLTRGGRGVTVVVRDFAEQFPKALSARPEAITVHLWPENSGKELDFRSPTLVRDYWRSWADLAPGGAAGMAKQPNNTQCAAKTHEIWLFPHAGPLDVAATARRAHAVCRPVLLLAEPGHVCASGAFAWPLQPRDPERFPAEERMIADFWDRLVFPYQVFPMTGAIAWGTNPYLRYVRREGRWYADFYRLSGLVEYGMRRHAWGLYARSFDRTYYEWAARFNQHAADWEMHHWNAGDRYVGGLAMQGNIHWPFPWGLRSNSLSNGVSGVDMANFLFEYYMTGNERALEAALEYRDSLLAHWDLAVARRSSSPFLILRLVTAVYAHTWDERLLAMARDLAHQLIDPQSPNFLTNDMPYGAMYKVDRNASALYDYWCASGDELAKEAFLKALDYDWRFNRIPAPIEYQNGKAYLYTIAYQMTGREEYRRIVNQLVQSGLLVENRTLAEEVGDTPPRQLERLPYRGPHLNMHPTLGMPTALWLLARAEGPIPGYPALAKPIAAEPATVLFRKPAGQPLRAVLYMRTTDVGDPGLRVLGPDGGDLGPLPAPEQRLESYAPSQFRHLSYRLEIPADRPAGVYSIPFGAATFQVLHAEPDHVALAAPEGFWVGGSGPGCGAPAYFHVPPELETLRLFLGRPIQVLAPDGSEALPASAANLGEVAIPVNGRGGAWAVRSPYPGQVRLLNVPPVVAFGDPARLFDPGGIVPPPRPRELPPAERFVPGVIGQALQLRGTERLRFPRGDRREDGSFAHFPLNEGTVELWFRPNWSSSDLLFKDAQLVRRTLVGAGSASFYYRYGQGPLKDNLYSYLDLLTTGPLGREGQSKTEHIGGHARLFFQAGQWQHLAATWRLQEGKRGTEGSFRVYLDGLPMAPTWNYPRTLDGRQPYRIGEIAEQITLGACDGSIDELRISDIIRYDGPFAPPRQAFAADARTLALFHFDGTESGVSGADGTPVPAR